MSPSVPRPEPAERISLDDIKHRAETVRDLAASEVRETVSRVTSLDATRKIIIVAGVAVAVISVAFYLGARAGARRYE